MKGMTLLNEITHDITNVYRTKKYIVFQSIHVCYGDDGNVLISNDVFHPRTPERDKIYEKHYGVDTPFKKRRRMAVAAYTRKYIN